jgi:hypothetical protein
MRDNEVPFIFLYAHCRLIGKVSFQKKKNNTALDIVIMCAFCRLKMGYPFPDVPVTICIR